MGKLACGAAAGQIPYLKIWVTATSTPGDGFNFLPILVSIAMAVTQDDPTHDGTAVEIVDEESHRSTEMRKVRYTEGPNEGATRWTFVEDVEGL